MSETQKCVPCGYESPIKCNFIRHISSKSHCKKCEIPIPEKTVSKKQAALLLAAEQAAKKLAEEQAVVLLAALQLAAQEAELNRLKEEAAAAHVLDDGAGLLDVCVDLRLFASEKGEEDEEGECECARARERRGFF